MVPHWLVDSVLQPQGHGASSLTARLLFLDAERALDLVNWNFMFETMRSFGFTNIYIKYIYNYFPNCIS